MDTAIDLSQFAHPDWQNAVSYVRDADSVLEVPILASDALDLTTRNSTTGINYNKNYTRSSFLLLKNGNTYSAYIMTIIADSAYLKNDLSKLTRNTYRQRDTDFTGLVLYYTPKGDFVSGWGFKNGNLIEPGSQADSTATTQNIKKRYNSLKPSEAAKPQDCTSYYFVVFHGDEIISISYMYTTCVDMQSSGGSPSTPPPPPPCTTSSGGSGSVQGYRRPVVSVAAPLPGGGGTGGGGMPPPTTTQTCKTTTPIIKTDTLTKNFPCAVNLIIDKLENIAAYNNLVLPFETNRIPNLTWTNQNLPWAVTNSNGTMTYQLGQTTAVGNTYSATIALNTSMLKNSSQLLIAAAAIHETLHGVINYNVKMAGYDAEDQKISVSSWLYGLDSWYTLNGLPTNYSNHSAMMTDYFSQAVGILANWDSNAHTTQQYAMAMLYGLNTSGLNPADPTNTSEINFLNSEYNSLLTKYNISATDMDAFWKSQLNAGVTAKLPCSTP